MLNSDHCLMVLCTNNCLHISIYVCVVFVCVCVHVRVLIIHKFKCLKLRVCIRNKSHILYTLYNNAIKKINSHMAEQYGLHILILKFNTANIG